MISYGKRFRDTEYFITENGDVYRNGKKLKEQSSYGYLQIKIYPETKWYKIHRLVAECYVPNPNNLPIVNHIDGVKTNNHYTNLEWVTDRQNKDHAVKNGLHPKGEDHTNILSTEQVIWIRNNYKKGDKDFSISSLSRRFNVSKGCIVNIIHHRTWKHIL